MLKPAKYTICFYMRFCHFLDPQAIQQDLVIVLDTNILLSHLDYVKRMISHGLGGIYNPSVVEWFLKDGCSLIGAMLLHGAD